jgi:hypothetical protein
MDALQALSARSGPRSATEQLALSRGTRAAHRWRHLDYPSRHMQNMRAIHAEVLDTPIIFDPELGADLGVLEMRTFMARSIKEHPPDWLYIESTPSEAGSDYERAWDDAMSRMPRDTHVFVLKSRLNTGLTTTANMPAMRELLRADGLLDFEAVAVQGGGLIPEPLSKMKSGYTIGVDYGGDLDRHHIVIGKSGSIQGIDFFRSTHTDSEKS